MRLRTVIPTLEGSPSNKDDLSRLLNAFDELQLLTPEDVVLRSSEQDLLEKLPHDIIDRRHISTLFQEIVDLVAAAPKRGDEVYAQEQELVTELNKYIHCINTGVPSIDALIRFPSLGIVELSGLPATGKTLMVKYWTLKCLYSCPDTFSVWLDTIGNFSPERTNQVAEYLFSTSHSEEIGGIDSVLNRLSVAHCPDLAAAYDMLEEININIKLMKATPSRPRTRLLVIDTISALLSPHLSATSSKGHALMIDFMRRLNCLVKEHRLLVFVINGATQVRETHGVQRGNPLPKPAYKPSLGPSFTYTTDITIFTNSAKDANGKEVKGEFVLTLLKSRQSKSGVGCRYSIKDGIILSPSRFDSRLHNLVKRSDNKES